MKFFTKDTSVLTRAGKRRLVTAAVVISEDDDPILHVHSWATGRDIAKELAEEERQALLKELLSQAHKQPVRSEKPQ